MGLLDDAIAATVAGPRVLSEQHDVGMINWVGGMSDPGEMIGCGMYQQLRRLTGEADAAYAARLPALLAQLPAHHRAKIETAMKGAAQRRASLDTTTGKVAVVVVGEPAWHRLGVNVASALTAADAIRLASLDWKVSKRAMRFPMADGTMSAETEVYALVRDDSQEMLGSVGARYVPIQNADGFDFLDSVVGEFGAHYHTAGAIYGGQKVWMQCELPAHGFELVRGDRVDAYATFTNPHDGSGKAWCFPSTNRIVCANTFRTASRENGRELGIRHTGNVKASILDARAALGVAVRGIDQFRESAEVMVQTSVDAPAFFGDLLDAVLDITAAEAAQGADALAAVLKVTETERELAKKRIDRLIDHRAQTLEDILTRYESERCGVGGTRGTQWSAFNAVTEHADYVQPRRQVGTPDERLSRRFESTLTGDADAMKQTAYEMLTAARA